MRLPSTPPDALLAFVARHLGEPASAEGDLSWPHAESAVWRVRAGTTTAILKAYRTRSKFDRERFALAGWGPALGGSVPRLLAVHETHPPALLIEHKPGRVDAPPTSGGATALHRASGAWLARLHALPHRDEDPLDLAAAYGRRARAWFARAAGRLPPATLDEARVRVEECLPQLRGFQRVPCHRDFTPRNWLAAGSELVAVIDFEHARPDLALADLVRLASRLWPHHPDLREAFLEGYGVDSLPACLTGLELLEAIATVAWADEHGDPALAAAGWTVLRRNLRSAR